LADRVRAFGGSVIYKADIEEILFKGSRAVGVQARLDGGSSTLTADTVVVNLGYEVLFNHLIKEPRGLGRLRKELGSASRRWLAASLLLGVEDAVIPEPLAGQAIVIPDETQEPAGENLILLTVSPAWDEGRAPLGKRALTVTTYLPAPNGGLTDLPHIDEAFVERLQRRLGRILPFLSTSIDLREIFQPEHYLHTVLRSADDLIRIEGLPQYMGMSGLPLKFAFRNLLFVGADSFLGPNAAGSVMSGWLAANVITS
jgi:phytoene dehydrogenase-like protein